MDRETETALENMVRIGVVTWRDPPKYVARVKFPDTGLTSGLLTVLGGVPEVGAKVLCLYQPIFNGDGCILGEIRR